MNKIQCIKQANGYLVINMDTLLYKVIPFSRFSELSNSENLNTLLSELDGKPFHEVLTPYEEKEEDNEVIPHLIPSYDCNYRCTYCYQNARKNNLNYMIPDYLPNIRNFYHEYSKCFNKHIHIRRLMVSGGEPFLPRNSAIIKSILSYWKDIPIDFTTNGAYLDQYKEVLSNHPKTTLTLSIDGIKEIHYRKRIPTDFKYYDRMIDNISWAISIGLEVYISCIFHPEYIDYYKLLFDELETLGWPQIANLHVFFSLLTNGAGESVDPNYLEETLQAIKILKSVEPRMNKVDIQRLMPGCKTLFSTLYNSKTQGHYSAYRCEALYKPSYTFTPEGTVIICSCIENDLGIVGRYWPQVEVYEERIRKIHQRRLDKLEKCKTCNQRVLCKGGCLATILSKGKGINETYCGIWDNPTFLKHLELFWTP